MACRHRYVITLSGSWIKRWRQTGMVKTVFVHKLIPMVTARQFVAKFPLVATEPFTHIGLKSFSR